MEYALLADPYRRSQRSLFPEANDRSRLPPGDLAPG
jgi:hypothetical protein